MAVRTKPVRIFESDSAVLTLLAGTMQRSPSDVAHAALAEYLHNHRDELSSLFEATQRALASGDIEAIAASAFAALDREVGNIVSEMPRPRRLSGR